MPTLADLLSALRRREGVEAAVLLGRDGLLIRADAEPGVDAERLAALVPGIVVAADECGAQDGAGDLASAVLEFERMVGIVAVLRAGAILFVLARPEANIGALVLELRRHRANMAALV